MSRRSAREFVELMRHDPELGCRIGEAVYSVKGQTGRYLIIEKQTRGRSFVRREIETLYITDFVQIIYDAGQAAKEVRL